VKTQYRFKIPLGGAHLYTEGPWRDTKSRAILDALENGATGKDEEIEMRSVPCEETTTYPPSSVTSNHP